MLRTLPLLRSCSIIALIALSAAGCASRTGEQRFDQRRQGSIKDDPVDGAPATVQPRRASMTRVSAPAAVVEKPVMSEPTPRLPAVEAPAPAVTVRIEQPVPPVTPTVAKPTEARTIVVEPPKTAVLIERPAPQHPQPPKNTETPSSDARPLTDTRRKPIETAPVAPPAVAAPSVPPPALPSAPVQTVRPAVQPTPVAPQPAPVAPVVPPPAPKTEAKAPTADAVAPKIVPLTDEQRVASTLQRADSYMKANRYQDARAVLDDAAKSGNPRLLAALAETYDPLHLREAYPRLARTGDPDKALALYEQARAAGARGLDARIQAVKTLAGPKR